MSKKNPKVGKSQVAGGVKPQLPIDSPLLDTIKKDQYDLVNIYTNKVEKTFVSSTPGSEDDNPEEDVDLFNLSDDSDSSLLAPNLEDITLIGKNGTRYSSGQVITDPDIYYDKNNNRFLRVTFEVKNSVGDIVKGVFLAW